MLLKMIDLVEAALPDSRSMRAGWQSLRIKSLRVDADNEHLFVIGTVEDGDSAARRQSFFAPPEKIVIKLFGRWRFERVHLCSLRIDARHHMPDRAVFAGSVHRLQNYQQCIRVFRIEDALLLLQLPNVFE